MALNEHLYRLHHDSHNLLHPLNSKVILVYVYMEDHTFRESCSTACISPENNWRLEKPRYEMLGENMVYVGKNSDKYPNNWLTRMIFGSKLMQNRHFPRIDSEENFVRHQKILEEFYKEVERHQNIVGAYNFFGFGNSPANINSLLPYVLKTLCYTL